MLEDQVSMASRRSPVVLYRGPRSTCFPSEDMTSPRPAVKFVVRFDNRRHHVAAIQMWFQIVSESHQIAFPVWTPGSYMVREYTRNIETIAASSHAEWMGPARSELPLKRVGKNRWGVGGEVGQFACVSYQLYCREMTVRTNWIESDYAFLTGAATFPFLAEAVGNYQIQLEVPDDWANIATSLQHRETDGDGGTHNLIAEDFDELVDSPIVCGNFPIREFEAGGQKHYFANVGADELWDLDAAIRDTRTLVLAHQDFWQVTPYKPYWFINLVTEGRGGLEHDNSTVLMCSRGAMRSRESYVDWLSLVSHEFFHTWNIRRLRPQALMQYDYEQEQFLEELWIAEGITSYLDDLTVARVALCSTEEYLNRLSTIVAAVQQAPGRLVQNLKDSSWDAWSKLYRPDENSQNARVSYYSKGALVAWLLDVQIQRATQGEKCIADLMRILWQRHLDQGYTQSDFDVIVAEVANASVQEWLQHYLTSTDELDFTPALEWLGLSFTKAESDVHDIAPYWGCEISKSGFKIMRVVRGTPADRAGVNVDDELVAVDGFRVQTENFDDRMKEYRAGEVIQLLVSRRGQIREMQLRLEEQPRTWQVVIDDKATQEAVQRRQQWLTRIE